MVDSSTNELEMCAKCVTLLVVFLEQLIKIDRVVLLQHANRISPGTSFLGPEDGRLQRAFLHSHQNKHFSIL